MSERTELLSICYHADDDTGLYHIGEIDFGVNARLESYIEKYGYKGVEEILAMLGHLAWEVKDCFYKINRKTEVKEEENEKPLICSYKSSCHGPDIYLSCFRKERCKYKKFIDDLKEINNS